MSKAVSWNTAGSGFDAREAAREAARRQGKSLGEWLHGVIADNAGETPRGEPSSRERIEAVTARLERMGATASHDRATTTPGKTERRESEDPSRKQRGRPRLVDDDDAEDRDDARPGRHGLDKHEAIEDAFATLERRARREARRTEDAIASVTTLIETNERRRARDRAGVESLADKLADIEARLSSRYETPIKGTLARLEARLEQIGRRGEVDAFASTRVQSVQAPQAVLAPQAASDLAQEAPRAEPPLRRRRLGESIAEIAERQRALDVGPRTSRVPSQRAGRAEISAEGGPLSTRLDDIRRAMAARPASSSQPREDDAMRREIAALAERLRDVAPRDAVEAVEDKVSDLAKQLGMVQERAANPASPDLSVLEQLVRDLGLRIEAVQAPGADAKAVDALQRDIGTLATRLEQTETGLAALGSLDRSMRNLFAHLEETRGYAETVAASAATEAVRSAIAEKGFDRPAPRADIAVLKAMQEDADVRTRATLDVVHEALDKVVDRLAALEHGLTEVRVARATRDEAVPQAALAPTAARDAPASGRRPQPAAIELGAAEPFVDPRFDVRARPRKPAEQPAAAGQAEFIAAARRAAHAAQTDPSVIAVRRPPPAAVAEEPAAVRAGLAVKSRDYVASHKRPVLMALAAVLLVAATAALMQRLPFGAAGPELAEAPASAKVAVTAASAEPQGDVMSRRPMPRATPAIAARIPGSDPIVTGSVPTLPAFAARPAAPAPKAAPLPAGLAAAAENGDGAAQYALAVAYAEGRAVPRDLARAAKLYAKAADKGIAPAQYRLGALYEKGLGVAQDKARARSLYLQAADAGSPRAMHNLAVLLADGDGRPDYEGAATWFRRAAQLGVHDSQFNLAILLARGLGVDQSLVQSYQWFAIAAQQGDNDAATKRDEVATKLSTSELSVAKALAAAFHAREPDPAAVDVQPPPGGWDGAPAPVHLNGARSKISSL